ncbi:MAG: hypothetical protein QNK37_08915 [Acidobacteriota bacterium]|nr:hypothetical protein [Acidobacteriota bacterium]
MKKLPAGTWRTLVLEFLSIVTGISLALLANDWHRDWTSRKRGKESLEHIRREIMRNYNDIEKTLPRLEEALDLLKEYQGVTDKAMVGVLSEIIQKQKHGFNFPLLQHPSWETAKNTGTVKFMDAGVARDLSRLEISLNLQEKRVDRLMNLIYNPEATDPEKTSGLITIGLILASDELYGLREVNQTYERMLRRMETILGPVKYPTGDG